MSKRLDAASVTRFVESSLWSLRKRRAPAAEDAASSDAAGSDAAGSDAAGSSAEVLHRSHKSKTARGAIERMAKIAEAAEAANHHPELFWVYNTLEIDLTTHDAGGITNQDLALAKVIDEILG